MAKSLVYKVTADDTKEPTGFQLKELSQLTFNSLTASSDLADILLKRLEKDSADVKYKTLKCIKYICLHGRTEFRQDVQRDAQAIKNVLHFRGNPDPLRGDAPFQRVRDEAKECMSAIFNGPANPKLSGVALEGYGGGGDSTQGSPTSESFSGGGMNKSRSFDNYNNSAPVNNHYDTSGSGKMVGFGNPQYNNSKGRSSPTFLEKMKAKMNNAGSNGNEQTGPYKPYDRPGGFQPGPIASVESTRKRGEVGGVWASSGGDDHHHHAPLGNGSSHHAAPSSSSSYQHNHASQRPTSSNGEYETRLIDSLTPAAGVRTQLSKDELLKFSAQIESLDKLLVVRIINNSKLTQDQHPATQMKALCLLECILTTGEATSTEEVEDYLCENAVNLEQIESAGANAALKMKAVRVMELCGLREEVKRATAPTPSSAPASASASAFYNNGHAAAPSTSTQPQPSTQSSHSPDLLAFATPAPTPATSAFGFLDPSPQPVATSSNDNMFSSMEIKAQNGAPQTTPAAAAAPAKEKDVFEMFAPQSGSSPVPQPSAPQRATSQPSSQNSNSLDFMLATPTTSTGGKVDPLTLLMSTAKISTQPRAPMMGQPMQPQPFGMNGMAGYPPRQNMPPLGPAHPHMAPYGMQPQGQPYGMPVVGYPPQFHGQPQQYPGLGGPMYGGHSNAAANSNALFQVKAAGSSAAHTSSPGSMRPTIDLDPQGNPILLANTPPTGTSNIGGSPSAFGFVASGSDTFGFVEDMMSATKK